MKWTATAAVIAIVVASSARGQVSCGDPDNLCTGDPCIIDGTVSVTSPCTVDFGTRTLVVRGRLHAPDRAVLDFTAGAIVVEDQGEIDGSNVGPITQPLEGGADITLTATGAIDVRGELQSNGDSTAGTITVHAGDMLTVGGRIRANGNPGFSSLGGDLILGGDAGVTVDGVLEATGYGLPSIDISSSSGDVTLNHKMRTSVVSVHAHGSALLNGDLRASWMVGVSSTLGNVTVNRGLRARTVSVDAGADLIVAGKVKAAEGEIHLAAAGHAQIGPGAKLDVRTSGGPGSMAGSLRVEAASADVMGTVRANGRGPTAFGGDVRFRALSGDLMLNGSFIATGRLGGGTIEGTAANALTAIGRFRAATTFNNCFQCGCIALSAGGTLDTSGAAFDLPLVADCPGSPSGAFLDVPAVF